MAVASLSGCKKNSEPAKPPAPTEEKATEPAKPTPPPRVAKKPPPPPKVTAEQRKAYLEALKGGRALAREKKWAEAKARFEAALKEIPMDSMALSELGWAAFQAGDMATARKANRDSVNAATADKIKAASLYNLGRVAEAQEELGKAAGYYARSLALRPHKVVAKRLADVSARAGLPAEGKKSPVAPDRDFIRCPGLHAGLEPLCECLKAGYFSDHQMGEMNTKDEIECGPAEGTKAGRARVISVRSDMMYQEEHFLVATQPGGKLEVLAHLATAYNPGAFGIHEGITHKRFEIEQRGGQGVLWSETWHYRFDTDMGIAEEESRDLKRVTLCHIPHQDDAPVTCPIQVPVLDAYERVKSEHHKEGDIDESMATKGLPIKTRTELSVTLADDGKVTVLLKAGKKTDRVGEMLGDHKLW